MGFLQRGVNNQPLKKQDNRKPTFTEFGIVKIEPPKPDGNKAVEFAKRLGQGREKVDHEFLVQNFGTVIQPDSKEPDGGRVLEIEKSFRGKRELDHEVLIQNFGR